MPKRPRSRGIAGLRLNVVRGPHRDDARRWYWRVIDNRGGRRETLWSGWAYEREAEAQLAQLAATGGQRPDEQTPDETVEAVRDLLEVWVAHLEDERPDLAPRSLRTYRDSARRIIALLGDVLLDRLDVAATESWAAEARRRWSPSTVSQDSTTLAAAWAWGRRRGICPVRDLPAVRVAIPRKLKRTPTEGELAAALARVRLPWARLLLRLQWATGARIGELAALRWDHVDWHRGEIIVDGKTGPRYVPVAGEVLEELRRWREECGADRERVMPVTEGTARTNVQPALDEACAAAGVTRWTTHAIRRAVVDRLARSGVEIATAADILGHSPAQMWASYRQVSAEDRRAAVARARLGVLPAGQVIDLEERRADAHSTAHSGPRSG